jgi:hydrogenase-4 component F
LTFVACLVVAFGRPEAMGPLAVDEFSAYLLVLTGFIGASTSLYSAGYVGHEIEQGRFTPRRLRFYHAMYQLLSAAMLVALLADNIGLMWLAIEVAAVSTVVMVGLHGTREAIEAAWKYLILGSVGVALALFGTILVHVAAQPALGPGIDGLSWRQLVTLAPRLDSRLLDLAFVFLLIGYGTKIGLAPMHVWLPDAHAEGPTPISAVLSGLLLNIACYALLRFKMILAANGQSQASGWLMATMGIASVLVAAAMLHGRRDAKRLFAYSSVEHMGLIAIAFGIGGMLANLAGLLHMALHALAKSAIFFAVGRLAQATGSQKLADWSALTASHPALGWSLVIAIAAVIGLPPLGLFTSEFMIVTAVATAAPWLAIAIVAGLLVAFAVLTLRAQQIAFGTPRGETAPIAVPGVMVLHLAIVFVAGLWLPAPIVAWMQAIARLLSPGS